jgi:hypothetical protein
MGAPIPIFTTSPGAKEAQPNLSAAQASSGLAGAAVTAAVAAGAAVVAAGDAQPANRKATTNTLKTTFMAFFIFTSPIGQKNKNKIWRFRKFCDVVVGLPPAIGSVHIKNKSHLCVRWLLSVFGFAAISQLLLLSPA